MAIRNNADLGNGAVMAIKGYYFPAFFWFGKPFNPSVFLGAVFDRKFPLNATGKIGITSVD